MIIDLFDNYIEDSWGNIYYTHLLRSFLNMNITNKIRYNIWKSLFNNNLFKLFNYKYDDDDEKEQLIEYSNLQFTNYVIPYETDSSNIELYKNILLENKSINSCNWLCSILLIHLNHFIFDNNNSVDEVSSLNRSFLYELFRRNVNLFIDLCSYCKEENKLKYRSDLVISIDEILNNSKLDTFFKENKEICDVLEKMKN